MKIRGYLRPDGRVGIRNYLLIIPSVVCANDVVRMISDRLAGSVYVQHQHGCAQFPDDEAQTRRTLAGFGKNPNVGACIVVGLGCEGTPAKAVAEEIGKSGKPVEYLVIQEEGGTVNTTARGVKIGRKMLQDLSAQARSEQDIGSITIGLECGGSDAWSGVSGNPSMGVASDMHIMNGGTSILSETTEIIGAEHLLAKRAVSDEVAGKLLEIVKKREKSAVDSGVNMRDANPSPGNKAGGLTTIEEKSLGCIQKAGSKAKLREVVGYAETPSEKGLVFMDTPGHDIESITGMAAGGAQLILFTTGRGTCTGCPIAPVIKISSNSATFTKMADNIDIDTGGIIEGKRDIQEMGAEIYDEVIAVCSGKTTKTEELGLCSFAIARMSPTQ